jgi:hypothetical protein
MEDNAPSLKVLLTTSLDRTSLDRTSLERTSLGCLLDV